MTSPDPDCRHEPGYRYYYTDPNTGTVLVGCRACGLTLGQLADMGDDLTMRPRPHDEAEDAPILHGGRK